MGFKDGVETLSVDGRRRRATLPGLERRAADPVGQLLRHLSEPAAHAAPGLHGDGHDLARDAGSHASRERRGISIPTRSRGRASCWEDAVEFWDVTNREDWAISERSHRGITSRGYTPGPYSSRETQLWEFDRFILSRVHGDGHRDQRHRDREQEAGRSATRRYRFRVSRPFSKPPRQPLGIQLRPAVLQKQLARSVSVRAPPDRGRRAGSRPCPARRAR